MDLPSGIRVFVRSIETYAHRPFHYPEEIGVLFCTVIRKNQLKKLEELIFHAKFLVQMQDILNRIGPGAPEFIKLSEEFQTELAHASECCLDIVQDSEQDEKFRKKFLSPNADSFGAWIHFLSDLRILKNWTLDGNPLIPRELFP